MLRKCQLDKDAVQVRKAAEADQKVIAHQEIAHQEIARQEIVRQVIVRQVIVRQVIVRRADEVPDKRAIVLSVLQQRSDSPVYWKYKY